MKVVKNIIMASVIMLCVPEVNADDQATQEQLVNVGLNTGFTGTNIEVSKVLNDYVSLRADMFISGSVSGSSTLEGNEFDISFTPDTKSLLLDVHPFSGLFYITGGLVNQNIHAALTGKPSSGTFNFNGQAYNTKDIGSFTGTLGFNKSTAPYIGMGWSNRNKSSGGLAFSFEGGIIDIGSAKVALNVKCGDAFNQAQCDTLQSNVTTEIDKVNKELIKKLNYPYPVVKLGISYRF
jgi:hypothetical protein